MQLLVGLYRVMFNRVRLFNVFLSVYKHIKLKSHAYLYTHARTHIHLRKRTNKKYAEFNKIMCFNISKSKVKKLN